MSDDLLRMYERQDEADAIFESWYRKNAPRIRREEAEKTRAALAAKRAVAAAARWPDRSTYEQIRTFATTVPPGRGRVDLIDAEMARRGVHATQRMIRYALKVTE